MHKGCRKLRFMVFLIYNNTCHQITAISGSQQHFQITNSVSPIASREGLEKQIQTDNNIAGNEYLTVVRIYDVKAGNHIYKNATLVASSKLHDKFIQSGYKKKEYNQKYILYNEIDRLDVKISVWIHCYANRLFYRLWEGDASILCILSLLCTFTVIFK